MQESSRRHVQPMHSRKAIDILSLKHNTVSENTNFKMLLDLVNSNDDYFDNETVTNRNKQGSEKPSTGVKDLATKNPNTKSVSNNVRANKPNSFRSQNEKKPNNLPKIEDTDNFDSNYFENL